MNRAIEIKRVLHLLLPFHSICIGYCFNKTITSICSTSNSTIQLNNLSLGFVEGIG